MKIKSFFITLLLLCTPLLLVAQKPSVVNGYCYRSIANNELKLFKLAGNSHLEEIAVAPIKNDRSFTFNFTVSKAIVR